MRSRAPGEDGKQPLEACQNRRLGNQAALVLLGRAQLGKLAQARHQRFELLLGLACRLLGDDALDLSKPGNDAGVDAICLLEKAHRLGELAHRACIDHGARQALGRQQREGQFLVSAGRLHDHELDPVVPAEASKCLDALGRPLKAAIWAISADTGIQHLVGDIYSTNHLCHGNLPCRGPLHESGVRASANPYAEDRGKAPSPRPSPRKRGEGAEAPRRMTSATEMRASDSPKLGRESGATSPSSCAGSPTPCRGKRRWRATSGRRRSAARGPWSCSRPRRC